MSSPFVSIQGHSIRVSNIKAFGISREEVKSEPEPQKTSLPGENLIVTALDLLETAIKKKLSPIPQVETPRYCLYVTSYQGDNYRFYGDKTEVERCQKILQDALPK